MKSLKLLFTILRDFDSLVSQRTTYKIVGTYLTISQTLETILLFLYI